MLGKAGFGDEQRPSADRAVSIAEDTSKNAVPRERAGFDTQDTRDYVRRLIDGPYQVVIPVNALREIAGQFFQERINLAEYGTWYRARKAAFEQSLLLPVFADNCTVRLHNPSSPGFLAVNRALLRIADCYRTRLPNKNPPMNQPASERRNRNPKFLDGADPAILEEAIEIARANPDRQCFLVTGDFPFGLAVREAGRVGPHRAGIPDNLKTRFIWDLQSLFKPKNLKPKKTTHRSRRAPEPRRGPEIFRSPSDDE